LSFGRLTLTNFINTL